MAFGQRSCSQDVEFRAISDKLAPHWTWSGLVPGHIVEGAISPDSTVANLTDENGPTTDFARIVYPDENFGGTGYENQTLRKVFWLNEDQTCREMSGCCIGPPMGVMAMTKGGCVPSTAKMEDRCRATGGDEAVETMLH